MAENTLGRKLVEKVHAVKIFDKMYKIKAEIVILEAFSAHADMNDLDNYIKGVSGLKKVLLVHGEEDQQKPFKKRIETFSDAEVKIMTPQVTIDL